jgi:Domain of unknown function (DUF4131)
MGERLVLHLPHALLAALCAGLAAANLVRVGAPAVAVFAVVVAAAAAALEPAWRAALVALALALGGWWWGSARLDAIDVSPLSAEVGRAARSRLVVTGPARLSRFEVRVPARMERFGQLVAGEPILLELPRGRSPPQGAVLDVLGVLAEPSGPEDGFDERSWLRRHGIHVILRGDRWRPVALRGGIGGLTLFLRGLTRVTLYAALVESGQDPHACTSLPMAAAGAGNTIVQNGRLIWSAVCQGSSLDRPVVERGSHGMGRSRGGGDEGQPARVPGQTDIRGLVTSRPFVRRGTAV